MNSRPKTHGEYRDRGNPWEPAVPADWMPSRLKRVTSIVGRIGFRGYTTEDIVGPGEGAVALSPSNIVEHQLCFAKRTYVSWRKYHESPEIIAEEGDVLLVKTGSTTGKVAYLPQLLEAATINPQMVLLKKCRVDARFLSYLLSTPLLQAHVEVVSAGGTMPTMTQASIGQFPVFLPPTGQDTQIARFIDYETARIDALIEKQQQLIALLKEKRQAVISHAVTKGLNPDAPLRDSGVEWLGMVPAHWPVGKCGFYVRILSGYAFPSSGFTDNESDVRLLRGINVAVGAVRWEDAVRWRRRAGDGLEAWELSDGDLVVGMDRPMISEGIRVARLTGDDVPCLLLQRVASLKPSPRINIAYLMHLLSFSKMFEAHFAPETTGVSVPHISPKQIADFTIPIPPRGEQDAIVMSIRERISRIDNLVRSAAEVASLLQERRTALISAAVTGKIDVRGWAPPESNAEQDVA